MLRGIILRYISYKFDIFVSLF